MVDGSSGWRWRSFEENKFWLCKRRNRACGFVAIAEIARILAFALVHDAVATTSYPGICRIRMTNPRLFGYDQLFVEARSDAAEPYFLLPLHENVPLSGIMASGTGCETSYVGCAGATPPWPTAERSARIRGVTAHGNLDGASANGHGTHFLDERKSASGGPSIHAKGENGLCPPQNTVSAATDDNLFVPSAAGPPFEVRPPSSLFAEHYSA